MNNEARRKQSLGPLSLVKRSWQPSSKAYSPSPSLALGQRSVGLTHPLSFDSHSHFHDNTTFHTNAPTRHSLPLAIASLLYILIINIDRFGIDKGTLTQEIDHHPFDRPRSHHHSLDLRR